MPDRRMCAITPAGSRRCRSRHVRVPGLAVPCQSLRRTEQRCARLRRLGNSSDHIIEDRHSLRTCRAWW